MKLLYQDGGRHGSFKDEKTFRSVLPFPVVYLSLVSLHFRLTSIEIGLSEISFLFSLFLSLSSKESYRTVPRDDLGN